MHRELTLYLPQEVIDAARAQADSEGRPVEEFLVATLEAMFGSARTDPRSADMAREVAAFEASHHELVAQFRGEYVAMTGGEVIDHDVSEEALFDRLEQSRGERVVLVRRVDATVQGPINVPSFRLDPLEHNG